MRKLVLALGVLAGIGAWGAPARAADDVVLMAVQEALNAL